MTDRIERLAAEYAAEASPGSGLDWVASAADFQAGYRRALADMQAMMPPHQQPGSFPRSFCDLMASVAKELEHG